MSCHPVPHPGRPCLPRRSRRRSRRLARRQRSTLRAPARLRRRRRVRSSLPPQSRSTSPARRSLLARAPPTPAERRPAPEPVGSQGSKPWLPERPPGLRWPLETAPVPSRWTRLPGTAPGRPKPMLSRSTSRPWCSAPACVPTEGLTALTCFLILGSDSPRLRASARWEPISNARETRRANRSLRSLLPSACTSSDESPHASRR